MRNSQILISVPVLCSFLLEKEDLDCEVNSVTYVHTPFIEVKPRLT